MHLGTSQAKQVNFHHTMNTNLSYIHRSPTTAALLKKKSFGKWWRQRELHSHIHIQYECAIICFFFFIYIAVSFEHDNSHANHFVWKLTHAIAITEDSTQQCVGSIYIAYVWSVANSNVLVFNKSLWVSQMVSKWKIYIHLMSHRELIISINELPIGHFKRGLIIMISTSSQVVISFVPVKCSTSKHEINRNKTNRRNHIQNHIFSADENCRNRFFFDFWNKRIQYSRFMRRRFFSHMNRYTFGQVTNRFHIFLFSLYYLWVFFVPSILSSSQLATLSEYFFFFLLGFDSTR